MTAVVSPSQKSDRTSTLPILWIDSIDGFELAEHLREHLQVLTTDDQPEPGRCNIVTGITERQLRQKIRKILSQDEYADIRVLGGFNPKLTRSLPLKDFLTAPPLQAWKKVIADKPLDLDEAKEIARDALWAIKDGKYPKSQWNIEKAELGERVSMNPFQWNAEFIKDLEREIHAAVNARQGKTQPNDSSDDTRRSKFNRRYDAVKGLWDGRLRLNTLKQRVELDGEPLDLDFVRADLCIELDIDIPKEEAVEIVLKIARENQYCPIVEYLEKVEATYPEPNINFTHLTSRLLNTSDPLHVAYLKRHLIGSVARALNPGCKMDTALILQGNQGIGKSSLFRSLYGDEFFDDTMAEASDKDELMKLHQHWACEWAEFETQLSRKGYSRLKQFMSTKVDNYRPPYARTSKSFLRRSVLVGSTNELEFLNDPSGDRRYWIIPVSTIDVASAEQLRDQIWAAAVQAYRNGEKWHLTPEEKQLADEANKPFRVTDTWEEFILAYCKGREFVTIAEILGQALDIEASKQDKGSQMRASAILRRLGWDKGKSWIGGTWKRGWVNPDFDRSTDPPLDEVDRSNPKVDRCQESNEINAFTHTDPPDPPFDQHLPENYLELEQAEAETRESLEKGGSVEEVDRAGSDVKSTVVATDPPLAKKASQVLGRIEVVLWNSQDQVVISQLSAIRNEEGQSVYDAAITKLPQDQQERIQSLRAKRQQ